MCMGWRHCKQLAKGRDIYIYIYEEALIAQLVNHIYMYII